MNLKDAFRYKNFLNTLADNLANSMRTASNIMETTRVHNMHAANPEAEDKTETVTDTNLTDVNAALRMYQRIIEETEKLTAAIDTAKTGLGFSMDALMQANIKRQALAGLARGILRNKPSETLSTGTGYKFNNEGTQTPYVYEITVKKTERFNREMFKAAMDGALTTSDEVSNKIDTAMVTTIVDYQAPWNVNATVEDILPDFMA